MLKTAQEIFSFAQSKTQSWKQQRKIIIRFFLRASKAPDRLHYFLENENITIIDNKDLSEFLEQVEKSLVL